MRSWLDDEDDIDIRQHIRAAAAGRLIDLLTARVKSLYDNPHDVDVIISEARSQLAVAAAQGNYPLATEMIELIEELTRELE